MAVMACTTLAVGPVLGISAGAGRAEQMMVTWNGAHPGVGGGNR